MINIQILNSTTELESFPITQTLKLKSTVRLDTNKLGDHIILFRLIPEKGLISLAEPYNYSLGYIKEKFSTIDLEFTQESVDDYFVITVKPKTVLNVNSDYVIYLTSSLFNSKVSINKSLSKSQSNVNADLLPSTVAGDVSLVTVKTTSRMVDGANTVTFNIDGDDITLNLKVDRSYNTLFFNIQFQDTVYIAGETFAIKAVQDTEAQDLMYQFRTTVSADIKPLETQTPSTSIDTQQILNFYKKVNEIKPSKVLIPKYISPNVFSITLPEGYVLDVNKHILLSIKEAFGNYLLVHQELYEKNEYTIYVYQEDNELFIEVLYAVKDDKTSVRDEYDTDLLFKTKRIMR